MHTPFYSDAKLTLADAAARCGGTVVREASFENLGMFRTFGSAMLTVFHDERFRGQFEENRANFSSVITTPDLAETIPAEMGILIHPDPLNAFLTVHEKLCAADAAFYSKAPAETSIAPTAKVHPTAVLAEHDVIIEDGVVIEPYAVIYARTLVGRDSLIGPHVTLGGPGFEMRRVDGDLKYIAHAGGVSIGSECHVFAHASIARAVFGGATIVGDRCKIDQFVHVGHGAVIGDECRLVAGSSVGGSTRLGRNTWVGPNAVIANSLLIGENAWIALGATCVQDVPSDTRVGGPFSRAMPR